MAIKNGKNEAIRQLGRFFVTFITIGMASGAFAAGEGGEPTAMATILERQRVMQLALSAPDAATIQGYEESLREDGSWPDVDYASRARSIWPPHNHLSRISAMALAYAKEGHARQGDENLLNKIYLALDHWLAMGYTSDNWWWNQIETPRTLGKIAVLINDELSGDRRRAMLEAIGKCPLGGTGANLMDQAQIVMIRACLANDEALLKQAVDAIVGEIKVTAGEGIQQDWSFHQHGATSHPLSYGKVYLLALFDVGWLLRGTPYEIPPEKREIVSSFILEGIQWMPRGFYTAPSTIDRQVSSPNALRGSGDFRGQLWKWIEVDPEHAPALEAFLARQNGDLAPLSGFRHYYRSDLTTYHRPGFALFLKPRSIRVNGTASFNSENLKGVPYLHTGDHYIIRDGSAYTDLPPVWIWSRLPGLTMFEGIGNITPQSFVGGLGDGGSGMSVMDYHRSLRVRKLWAFHGDLVVCLLGGWQGAEGKQGLRTTLDQCALNGPVWANVGGETVTLERGDHHLADVSWVLHNGVGYVPLKPSSVALSMREATGSWKEINASQSDAVVKADVFTCDLLHGASPAADGFILVPGSTGQTLDLHAHKPPYEVIQNDGKLQCIRFDDGTVMAAFYEPGQVTVDEKLLLKVDKPCLAVCSGSDLYLCDPTNPVNPVPMRLTWQGVTKTIYLPAVGKPLRIPPGVWDKLYTYSSVQLGAYNDYNTWGRPSNEHPGRGSSNGFASDFVTVNTGHTVNIPRAGTPNDWPQATYDTIHVFGILVGDQDVENVFGSTAGGSSDSDTALNLHDGSTLRYRLQNGNKLAGGKITVKGNSTLDRNDQVAFSDGDNATFRSLTFDTAGKTLTIDGGSYVGGDFSGTLFNLPIVVQQDAAIQFQGSNNFTAKDGFDIAAGKTLAITFGSTQRTNFRVNGTSAFGENASIQVGAAVSWGDAGLSADQGSLEGGTLVMLAAGRAIFNVNATGANNIDLHVTGNSRIRMANNGNLGDFSFEPGYTLTLDDAGRLDLTGSGLTVDVTALEVGLHNLTLFNYAANDLAGMFGTVTIRLRGGALAPGTFGALTRGQYAINYGQRSSADAVVLQVYVAPGGTVLILK